MNSFENLWPQEDGYRQKPKEEPVSYTHLDVYKRQPLYHTMIRQHVMQHVLVHVSSDSKSHVITATQ